MTKFLQLSVLERTLMKVKKLFLLSAVYRVMDARGKFGEHEKCVRVKSYSRHLIYAWACIKKDFVHSSSIGLTQGKHARYVIGR